MFLRGAGGVAIGLPFLEGLPERSAWAADAQPVFSSFIVAACGVVGSKFFPSATGALSPRRSLRLTDKATSVLAPHAREPAVHQGHQLPDERPDRLRARAGTLPGADRAAAPGGSGAPRTRAASRPTW